MSNNDSPGNDDETNWITGRRKFLVGSGVAFVGGIAASSALSAGAASAPGAEAGQGRPRAGLIDPRKAYPQPPYPHQEQPWPGLASKMRPLPDHGEATYRGNGRLEGRKALITGGDSGIGRAAAIAYAREGADVAINYLPEEEEDAQEVMALIRRTGRQAYALPGDIRGKGFCLDLVRRAASLLGSIDTLVLNAAYQQQEPDILKITDQQLESTFLTNINAMVWMTQEALRVSMPPGSVIIVTTSEQGYDPSPYLVDYAMTKSAQVSYVRSMAKQLGAKGIRVNGVAPGPIWTPLQITGGTAPEKIPNFGGDKPLGRAGQPAELASIFVQLAASDASYATGQVYGAEGGAARP
ncbi:SDR family oxidoreductase [Stenotrophomonas sp. CC120222-04]|uniref:SDR family oxidoreductase n=1 Tax=Stenotrophomonas sp. CC120222-04 TaxID=1378088 RepID=UPI000B62A648|nr:SDR family oxidoreductase [Stenotrophomonas sp. CC120222-04]SNT83666.1 NAD(P)-dependent dehydrogenase, short-chain alcohol dehydrogenase family [Stenotrophomonas sp. CC120222-04]